MRNKGILDQCTDPQASYMTRANSNTFVLFEKILSVRMKEKIAPSSLALEYSNGETNFCVASTRILNSNWTSVDYLIITVANCNQTANITQETSSFYNVSFKIKCFLAFVTFFCSDIK